MPNGTAAGGAAAGIGAGLLASNPVGWGVGAALGLYSLASGLIKSHKAKKEAEELGKSRPQYSISPYAGEDVSLAQSELSNNVQDTAYNEQMDRDLASSLDAVLKSGGTPNNISDVFDASAAGRQRYAIMRDNLRLNKINNLVRAHDYYNDQLDKQWQINQFAPWADKAQANAAARNSASQQINQGINTVGNLALGNSKNAFDSYLNQPKQVPQNYTPYQIDLSTVRTTSPIPDMSRNAPTYINPNSISQLPPLNFGDNNNFDYTNTYGE